MPRPPTPIGAWGSIKVVQVRPGSYKARARVRDRTGQVRSVARFADTSGRARAALLTALAEWRDANAELHRGSSVNDLATAWLERVDADTSKATGTRQHYHYVVERYVRPQVGELRIGEATTARVDAAIQRVKDKHGPGAAASTRKALNGMFRLAVAWDAAPANPIRETTPISGKRTPARVLTSEEIDDLVDRIRADRRAVEILDLPDLCEFMLGTAVRIGEACAVRALTISYAARTIEIDSTVVRIKGQGLVLQDRPKTAGSHRILKPPAWVFDMLERRAGEPRVEPPHGVVFGSPKGMLRDPSNTAGDIRATLDRLGYEWVTSHVFRKTALTRLAKAGLSAPEVADIAGHTQVSTTQNVYMGRKVVTDRMAELLDR